MKFKLLGCLFSSTLSCILKCLRFFSAMIYKKIFIGLIIISFLGACTAPTAMLGPAYTFSTTGNIMQTGFTYGSSEMVTLYTGKSPMENIKEITSNDQNNVKKQTLESDDFYNLVSTRIKKTNAILNSSSR